MTLTHTAFVLVETSLAENIGASARAMKTMGFDNLRLVCPRCNYLSAEAFALASGAGDVLEAAQCFSSLNQALFEYEITIAFSARVRDFGPPLHTPQWLNVLANTQRPASVAFVFGSERYGLSNEDVYAQSALLHIPANPAYSSLNLSQAVQIIAYLWREALMSTQTLAKLLNPTHASSRNASHGELQLMVDHLMQALSALEFFDSNTPKKLLPRIQRFFHRATPTVTEVNIARGICKAILKKCDKA